MRNARIGVILAAIGMALSLLGVIGRMTAQKAVRTTPIPVGAQTDIEIVHVGFDYQFDPSAGQFRCVGVQINAVEGEVKNDIWRSYEHHRLALENQKLTGPVLTTAGNVKDRALRVLLKELDLETAAPIVVPSTVTTTTTTTTTLGQ